MTFRLAFMLLHWFGGKHIKQKWGIKFYHSYKKLADQKLKGLEAGLPPGVNAAYDINYKFIAAYAAMYHALISLNVNKNEIDETIWKMNESLFNIIPKGLMARDKDSRKDIDELRSYQEKGEKGLLGKNDWLLKVNEETDGTYHVIFTQCGAYNILTNRGYGYVFPCACRIDYLMSNKFGTKFERTKTIADGDGICDNHIMGSGFTEWAPEKGFITRK